MKTITVPDEIVPLVEMLIEIWQRDPDGRVKTYTSESIKGMMLVLERIEAEKRGKLFIVDEGG